MAEGGKWFDCNEHHVVFKDLSGIVPCKPTPNHFRNDNYITVQAKLLECWQECIEKQVNQNGTSIIIPLQSIKMYDTEGEVTNVIQQNIRRTEEQVSVTDAQMEIEHNLAMRPQVEVKYKFL